MKKFLFPLAAGALLAVLGCEKKEDPRDRPGFIDTSDPSKVKQTMTPLTKTTKDPTSLGGKKGP